MLTISDPDSLVDSANAPVVPKTSSVRGRPSASSVVPRGGDLGSGPEAHGGSPTGGASGSVPGSIGGCVLRSTNVEPHTQSTGPRVLPVASKVPGPIDLRPKPDGAATTGSVPDSNDAVRPARRDRAGSAGPDARATNDARPDTRGDAANDAPAALGVDPKIARRRAEVRRSAHEIRRRRGLIAIGVTGVAMLSGAVLLSPLVGVSTISVSGSDDASRVVTASGIRLGSPLLRVSASDAETRIKAMPEFADATVTKHWMRKVSIKVVPRVPVAMVVGSTNTILVAENGTAIRSVPSTTTDAYDLPRLDGIPPASVGHALVGDAAALAQTAASLGPLARKYTLSVSIDNGNVVLDVQPPKANAQKPKSKRAATDARASVNVAPGHVRVTFGNVQELDLKGRALEAMLASESMDGYHTADLGVPDAPVLGT